MWVTLLGKRMWNKLTTLNAHERLAQLTIKEYGV